MAMTDATALRDDATVVAPRERSPELRQYLAMVMSADRVLGTKKEWQVDELLEFVQSRGEPVPLRADSAIHLEGLRCLAQSIHRDTYYDEIGKAFANYYLYDWITKYLQFERDLIAFPDIVSVPVAKPMFLIGYGRTGSTFLQHLLALDPQARSPRLWELMEPSPPPRPETYESDPRIRRVRMHLNSRSIMMPDVHKIHESDVEGPEECYRMMWHGLHHVTLGLRSAEYGQWLANLSPPQLHAVYSSYRLQVQHLQLFHRKGHWVSKSLSHAHFLPVLFKVFPDARVVRLHRDPCQVIPALASLVAHAQVIYTSRIDFHELGERMLQLFLDTMDRLMQIDHEVGAAQFIDVLFDDIVGDPLGIVREIYSRFDYRYTPEFEEALQTFLAKEEVTRKYKHVYSLEQFGLSRAQVIARSEKYLDWVEQRTGARLCA
jgi:hypothetical protein